MSYKIDTPDLEAAAPGLLDAITVIDGTGHQLFNETKFDLPLDGHNTDVPAPGVEKDFDTLDEPISTVLFQQYRGIESPVLLGEESAALVKDAYERGETYSVERKIQELVLNPVAVDITPTPGTPVTSHKLALGLLEQYARDNSTFKPFITGNALAITMVGDFIPNLETLFKTTVSLAGGYGATGPGGRVAGAGQAWLYVHGKIILWRGPSDAEAVGIDYRTNRKYALAEGSYAAAVTNFAAAILVGI
jgi:hypothetical protein